MGPSKKSKEQKHHTILALSEYSGLLLVQDILQNSGGRNPLTWSMLKNPAVCNTWHKDSTSFIFSTGSIPLFTISNKQSHASSRRTSTDMWLSSIFINLVTGEWRFYNIFSSQVLDTNSPSFSLGIIGVRTYHWLWGISLSKRRKPRLLQGTGTALLNWYTGNCVESGTTTPPDLECTVLSWYLLSEYSCEPPKNKQKDKEDHETSRRQVQLHSHFLYMKPPGLLNSPDHGFLFICSKITSCDSLCFLFPFYSLVPDLIH